jgi:hypothetical protein
MVSDMTPAKAHQITAHVAAQRLRWGKHYDATDIGLHNLLDAIVVLGHEGNKEDAGLRDQITTLNRQLAAAKAREAKAAKRQVVNPNEHDE